MARLRPTKTLAIERDIGRGRSYAPALVSEFCSVARAVPVHSSQSADALGDLIWKKRRVAVTTSVQN